MVVENEAYKAFLKAIEEGRMTEEEASGYMYMGTKDNGDLFKNIVTREYLI